MANSIINHYYPFRGHCYLFCDRNLSVIKRVVQRPDRIYSPNQYEEIICTGRKSNPPFEVKAIQSDDILNFKGWWSRYAKKKIQIRSEQRSHSTSVHADIWCRILNKGILCRDSSVIYVKQWTEPMKSKVAEKKPCNFQYCANILKVRWSNAVQTYMYGFLKLMCQTYIYCKSNEWGKSDPAQLIIIV